MELEAVINFIREVRLDQVETLKELEEQLLIATTNLDTCTTSTAEAELSTITINLQNYKHKVMSMLEDLDILELSLEETLANADST